ncbi:hypothetical protein BCS42_16515 [Crenothrix sp. D3]|nr:hypothetical protein BCS42_16515 [Crenothrix sp. D3]
MGFIITIVVIVATLFCGALIIDALASISAKKTTKNRILQIEKEKKKQAAMSPDEKQRHLNEQKSQSMAETQKKRITMYGGLNVAMICPHCQTKGKTRTKHIIQKKGVSGAKATGAVLTGGLSLLATGLSRKEDATQAYCENCNSTWSF